MKKAGEKVTTVAGYIAGVSPEARDAFAEMRRLVVEAAPGAEEVISYGMPAIKKDRILVYYAAAKNHIGLYPTASGVRAFEDQLDGFVFSKGAIRFPLDKPLPRVLVRKIVRFRMKEESERLPKKK